MDASEEQIEEALKRLQQGAGSDKDFKMSSQEAEKIQPEFRKLFSEYMEEMSDPKNRAEVRPEGLCGPSGGQSDAYLRQLEGEGNVPEGMAMCQEGLARLVSAQAKDGQGSKVFINVTHCTEIAPAETEEAIDPATNKPGKRWKLPFTISPQPQYVEDHSGEKVQSWDVAVNSDTFERHVRSSQKFCDLLVRSAIEDIKAQFKAPIDPDSYKVLKKRKYMGGRPVPMNLANATNLAPPAKPEPKPEPKPARPSPKGKQAVPRGFLDNKQARPDGPIEPEYSILHRDAGTQLQDAWKDDGLTDRVQAHKRPDELVIRLELPGLKSVAGVDLDITEHELCLESEPEVSPQFKLKLKLPYPVDPDSDTSTAKWVPESQKLFVVLKVVPPAAPPVAPQTGPLITEMEEEEEEEPEPEPEPEPELEVEPEPELEVEVEEVEVDGVRTPQWEFHDNKMNATLVLRYAGVAEQSVLWGIGKEGMAVEFQLGQARYQLALNTYAPVIPNWSRVKLTATQLELVFAKAQPGPWERVGKCCSVDEAGVQLSPLTKPEQTPEAEPTPPEAEPKASPPEAEQPESEPEPEPEPAQSKWDWVQEAREGTAAGCEASGVESIEPDEPPKQPRMMKQKFESGFLAKKQPEPIDCPAAVSEEEEEEEAPRIWSPTQIRIENKLVLELD